MDGEAARPGLDGGLLDGVADDLEIVCELSDRLGLATHGPEELGESAGVLVDHGAAEGVKVGPADNVLDNLGVVVHQLLTSAGLGIAPVEFHCEWK